MKEQFLLTFEGTQPPSLYFKIFSGGENAILILPYWLIASATSILPAWVLVRKLLRRRMRAKRLCPTCGYDLRATPNRCPECGTIKPSPASS
jgi:hypothetical protein